ncbi:peptide deformylase [Schaalia suimastitidis]|uniref:peptide deformylase n=1 Tax=Schaalia suimastitidis TaxID=121163 RepID=UPI00040E4970|nr:peptide deformylase [Schaalia suimastitidis]
MTVLPITITGTPVLHAPAREVAVVDDNIRTLIVDMFDTMRAAPGVGLAAPQVGVDLQIFVWEFDGHSIYDRYLRRSHHVDIPRETSSGHVINPRLELSQWRDDSLDREREREGCLSVPGYDYPLRRADHAVLTGSDMVGHEIRVEARGWLARIFQHEYDHLLGTLYVDRLTSPFDEAAQRAVAREGWGVGALSWTPQG